MAKPREELSIDALIERFSGRTVSVSPRGGHHLFNAEYVRHRAEMSGVSVVSIDEEPDGEVGVYFVPDSRLPSMLILPPGE